MTDISGVPLVQPQRFGKSFHLFPNTMASMECNIKKKHLGLSLLMRKWLHFAKKLIGNFEKIIFPRQQYMHDQN